MQWTNDSPIYWETLERFSGKKTDQQNYEPLLSAFLNLSKVITEAQRPIFFPYGIQDLTRVLCSFGSVKTPSNLEVLCHPRNDITINDF